MTGLELFPETASTQAHATDRLFLLLMLVSVAIIILVVMLVVTFALRYRRGSQAKRGSLKALISRQFEIGWTMGALFLGLFIFWWSSSAELASLLPANAAMEIHIVGKQWMWKTQHANGAREINALHVPVNEPVRLIMTSEDVIHSFFVPAFRVKKDVLPGSYTETWFEATKTGTQHLFCTQFCGTQHSRMIGDIVVMSQEDFARWLRSQPQTDDLAKEGAALFVSLGCSGCHEGHSPVRAPRLEGLYGSQVALNDGRVVTADDAYIRSSILDPSKDVTGGYEALMPSFQDVIGDDELIRLIAYIRALKDGKRL